jgi:hypothetical protein
MRHARWRTQENWGEIAVRKILSVVAAVAVTTILGAGVAEAAPRTYEVTNRWSYSFVDGELVLLPPMEDDVVEATCRNGDKMKDYEVSDPSRVLGEWRRTDGTGVQLQPDLRDEPFELAVTLTCRKR